MSTKKTSRSAWKRREAQAAALVGARRQRCSGSSGRPDCSRSDSTHPSLFIETKLRMSHAARKLHDAVKIHAEREHKTPVLMLADKGRPGVLICVHSDHLDAFVRAYLESIEQREEPS